MLTRKTAKNYGIELYGTLNPCKGCGTAKAKQKAVSETTNIKATRSGKRIFMDAAGPYHETLGGNIYWFQGVDDSTKIGWNGFVAYKSKMAAFVESIIIKMKGRGMPVKYLHCNNAGESVKALKALCNHAHGISIKFTAPETPQQNGVVKRRIAVLTQRANAMTANLNEEGRKIYGQKL